MAIEAPATERVGQQICQPTPPRHISTPPEPQNWPERRRASRNRLTFPSQKAAGCFAKPQTILPLRPVSLGDASKRTTSASSRFSALPDICANSASYP